VGILGAGSWVVVVVVVTVAKPLEFDNEGG